MIVRDLMTNDPKTVTADATLADLADVFDDYAIRHAPVVDKTGDVIGVVSHRDLVQGALRSHEAAMSQQRAALRARTVSEVMTYTPQTVAPDDSLADAAQLMLENKFGCLLVFDNEQLVGILTESDFVRYVVESEMASAKSSTRAAGKRKAAPAAHARTR